MKNKNIAMHVALKVVMIFVLPVLVLFLWNWIIPSITGWTAINYLQALGLMILGRLLTGSFGGFINRKRGGNVALNSDTSREERRKMIREYFNNKNEQ